MNLGRKEIRVGLLVLVALASGYLAIAWLSRKAPFSKKAYVASIQFDQAGGLLTGDPVVWRGVEVGQVTAILPRHDAVRVEISLDRDLELRANARAELQVRELMGGKQIALSPGNAPGAWPPGTEIPGRAGMDFPSSFSAFSDYSEAIRPESIRRWAANLDSLFSALGSMERAISPEKMAKLIDQALVLAASAQAAAAYVESAQLGPQALATLHEARATLVSVQAALNKADSTASKVGPSAERVIEDTHVLLAQSAALLAKIEALPLWEAAENPELLQRLDSTLIRLNHVLDQIHNDRLTVGLRLRKPRS